MLSLGGKDFIARLQGLSYEAIWMQDCDDKTIPLYV